MRACGTATPLPMAVLPRRSRLTSALKTSSTFSVASAPPATNCSSSALIASSLSSTCKSVQIASLHT